MYEFTQTVFPYFILVVAGVLFVISFRKNDKLVIGDTYLLEGMPLGMILGVAFSTSSFALDLALGMLLGVAIGLNIEKHHHSPQN